MFNNSRQNLTCVVLPANSDNETLIFDGTLHQENNYKLKKKAMSIQEFAKSDFLEKTHLLKHTATLIDSYMDADKMIFIYSLSEFFVEVTIDTDTETIIDIIPYKRGFFMNKNYLVNDLKQSYLSYVRVAC